MYVLAETFNYKLHGAGINKYSIYFDLRHLENPLPSKSVSIIIILNSQIQCLCNGEFYFQINITLQKKKTT
jgi:hypothetical protein